MSWLMMFDLGQQVWEHTAVCQRVCCCARFCFVHQDGVFSQVRKLLWLVQAAVQPSKGQLLSRSAEEKH